MSPSEDCLFEIAASQGGYFTAAQARDCGYSWSLLSHHASNGRFVRARKGLYRFRRYPSSPKEEVIAVWLAAGAESVVSHESALDLLGLADTTPDSVHLTVPRSKRSRRPPLGVTVHTTTSPLGPDEVAIRNGMRVTSPGRTILDVAQSGVAPDQVAGAVREAVDRGMVMPDQLLAGARRRGGRVEKLLRDLLVETST